MSWKKDGHGEHVIALRRTSIRKRVKQKKINSKEYNIQMVFGITSKSFALTERNLFGNSRNNNHDNEEKDLSDDMVAIHENQNANIFDVIKSDISNNKLINLRLEMTDISKNAFMYDELSLFSKYRELFREYELQFHENRPFCTLFERPKDSLYGIQNLLRTMSLFSHVTYYFYSLFMYRD